MRTFGQLVRDASDADRLGNTASKVLGLLNALTRWLAAIHAPAHPFDLHSTWQSGEWHEGFACATSFVVGSPP